MFIKSGMLLACSAVLLASCATRNNNARTVPTQDSSTSIQSAKQALRQRVPATIGESEDFAWVHRTSAETESVLSGRYIVLRDGTKSYSGEVKISVSGLREEGTVAELLVKPNGQVTVVAGEGTPYSYRSIPINGRGISTLNVRPPQ